ncbi:MAG: hypothetical protein MZV70_64425 [Desulfobacterales bacterium]|nr:hypothetical protein [Desulfobacterales bacterium]
MRTILAGRAYWMLMLAFGLGIGASLGIYAVLPIVLVGSHGLEREQANTILALTRIPGVAVAFVSGWFTGPLRAEAHDDDRAAAERGADLRARRPAHALAARPDLDSAGAFGLLLPGRVLGHRPVRRPRRLATWPSR